MGLPLNRCAVLAVTVCSVLAVTASANPGTGTTYRMELDKWWEDTAKAKSRQRAESGLEQDFNSPALVEPIPTFDRPRAVEPVLTSRFGYDFAEHKSSNFHIMYRQQDVPAEAVRQTAELLETAYQKFLADYNEAGFKLSVPKERLCWVVFNDEEQYQDFARLADGMTTRYLDSYYAARTNQVVLMQAAGLGKWKYGENRLHRRVGPQDARSPLVSGMDQPEETGIYGGGGMLDVRRAVHEAAHQLAFNSGLQKRGVMYPLWVSEGLATNFECDSGSSICVAGDNAPRKRQLLRAHSASRLMPLRNFVTMAQIRPDGQYSANDLYAQSWALFNYLFKDHRADLKTYLARLARLEPGPRDSQTMYHEFTSVFGSVENLEAGWNRYLNSFYDN